MATKKRATRKKRATPAKKRASMREGPLADLFRSTDEAVADGEVTVTVVPSESEPVAVVEPEPTVIRIQDDESDGIVEAPPIEQRRVVKGGPLSDAAQAITDPLVEEVDERPRPRSLQVSNEPEVAIEHEGLARLMGADLPLESPAYGRDEPDGSAAQPTVPRSHQAVLRVVGVGGAGVNAVNRMVEAQLPGVEFLAINTDLQSLQNSNADTTLHIGSELTRGLGSGSDPRVGYRAAYEEQDKIKSLLAGSDMVFIAAGAGGGTGTGAAPVVAKLARDVGALTVAAVTKPFMFEGARRAAQAEQGIAALSAEVDTLIVVPNERLLKILDRRTAITDAFRVADDVLRQAVQGISDLVMLPGLINLDFADVRTTMVDSGDAILGIGMGIGEHRAVIAAEKAVASPLLETSVDGAQSLLLSITGGPDLSLIEASEAARVVQEAAHPDANIIFGASVDEDLDEQVWVTVIATRFDSPFSHFSGREAHRGDDPYSDPADAWRGLKSTRPKRLQSADEIYGEGTRGRGPDRRSSAHSSTNGGLVLDVPEFIPGH